jgi:integrase
MSPRGAYWFVKWWEPKQGGRAGRERSRCFSGRTAKRLADHYAKTLYARLNSDVFTDPIRDSWSNMVAAYRDFFRVRGCTDEACYQAMNTLNHFAVLVGTPDSTSLTQQHIDQFLIARQESAASRWTVNKDVSNLRAFLSWARGQRYLRGEFRCDKLKVGVPIVESLTVEQVRRLLAHCPTDVWQMRILVSLCTGLRAETVDNLRRCHIDFDRMLLSGITEQKTLKTVRAPLPAALRLPLSEYMSRPGASDLLFPDRNIQRRWEEIRIAGGFAELDESGGVARWRVTRQHFRRTYSSLVAITEGLAAASHLLRHSDLRVTMGYTDELMLLRHRVNQLPVDEWLKPEGTRDENKMSSLPESAVGS